MIIKSNRFDRYQLRKMVFSVFLICILFIENSLSVNNYHSIGNGNSGSVGGGVGGINHGLTSSHNDNLMPQPHDRCEPITIPICMHLPYNMTIMPNFFNQARQDEAGLEVHQFAPLVKVECSPDLLFFLCSLYVPVCTILEYPIPPCRNLCESARICEGVMRTFDFHWPENLECSKFPEYGGDELCISQNTTDTTPSPSSSHSNRRITNPSKNGMIEHNGGTNGGNTAGTHIRNIGFVCPVQLKTPTGLGYSLKVGGKVSHLPSIIHMSSSVQN